MKVGAMPPSRTVVTEVFDDELFDPNFNENKTQIAF